MSFQNLIRFVGRSRIHQGIFLRRLLSEVRRNNVSPWRFVSRVSFASLALLGLSKSSGESAKLTGKEVLLAKADALFEQGEYRKIYELLENYKDNKDVEILWRLCRALYNMSKSASDVEAKKMIYEAYDLSTKSLAIKEDHWAVHKWRAILVDGKTNYEGIKARIQQLENVKNHLLRAAELNPEDATTLYMIGNWCYSVSDLAWYQRKLAAAIFGTPPTSSFEEALQYFLRAEEIDPNFYSQNLLYLGKTFLKLGKKEDAQKYLTMAAEYSAKNDEDLATKLEASKLLASI